MSLPNLPLHEWCYDPDWYHMSLIFFSMNWIIYLETKRIWQIGNTTSTVSLSPLLNDRRKRTLYHYGRIIHRGNLHSVLVHKPDATVAPCASIVFAYSWIHSTFVQSMEDFWIQVTSMLPRAKPLPPNPGYRREVNLMDPILPPQPMPPR